MNIHPYCNVCNKQFSSKSSLCNHNKRFHSKKNTESTYNQLLQTTAQLLSTNNKQKTINIMQPKLQSYPCRYCNKEYSIIQSRWKHEKNCKEKKNKEREEAAEKEKKEIESKILQLQLKKEEAKSKQEEFRILKLKLQLQKSEKKSEDNTENNPEMMSSHTIRNLNKLLAKLVSNYYRLMPIPHS